MDMFPWIAGSFILIVHWLLGKRLARFGMFAVMVTATYLYVQILCSSHPDSSFVPPLTAIGVVLSWLLSGIPYRYRRRQVKQLASELAALPPERFAEVARYVDLHLAGR